MNKQELIDRISRESGLSKKDSKNALEGLLKTISKELKKGRRVSIIGFGSFSISKRSARTGRNPQTGKEIKISSKQVVRFKPSKNILGTGDDGPGKEQ